jgi:mannose-1-phosphate guanylyltransferase
MRTLLLAAGFGTRLRPLTDTVPKCLVQINGRPLIDYWLELLGAGGVTKILVNLHYLPEAVSEFLAQSTHALEIRTAYENCLLGTAGTILKNKEFFQQEPFLLIHADNLSLFDIRHFMRKFVERENGIDITMMTFHTDAPETCGIVELDDRGVVRAFHEKIKNPTSNLANAAVYIVAPGVIEFIASLNKKIIDFSIEILPHYLGRINTFHNDTYHRDIGNIESLAAAQIEYPVAVARDKFKNVP